MIIQVASKKIKQALWSSPGNTLSNTLKHLIFIFIFIFNHEELYINQEITK